MNIPLLDLTKKTPIFGEIFIANEETSGGLECLQHFKGKLIASLGGGCGKLFVIEDGVNNEGILSSLHAPEFDEYDYTFNEDKTIPQNIQDVFSAFDGKGTIKKILSGRKHLIFLTDEGKLFAYGNGEYGSLGLGGVAHCYVPQMLKKISDKKIIQIACGEYHTMALTDKCDLYTWGRGFEGQLGLGKEIRTASSPQFVTHFYEKPKKRAKIPVRFIACGAYHSLCITVEGDLYGWGEAKLGQLGTGKKDKELLPIQIHLNGSEDNISGEDLEKERKTEKHDLHLAIKINMNLKTLDRGTPLKVRMVSAGFGHTAAISENGDIYTWGFNVKGQLGLGDKKSRYYPAKILRDILSNDLPVFNFICCGYYNNFAIDESGKIYSWGGGNLGQKDEFLQDMPRKIEGHTEGRIFTDIFSSKNSTILFAGLRIMSIRPHCGPSQGGTMLSLIGTGFVETGKQSVRFSFGKYKLEVGCSYDATTECFHCVTPKFDDAGEENIPWPMMCSVELTLDGNTYLTCEKKFLIYSSKILVSSIFPKCASVKGGTMLTLNVTNLEESTVETLSHLTVGFQAKSTKKADQMSEAKSATSKGSHLLRQESMNINHKEKNVKGGTINPLDLSITDPELDKENWICVGGVYSKGKITCIVPMLEEFNSDSLQFNVDISLNGQQFTGQPSSFRFYDITIKNINPRSGISAGGTIVKIDGDGFFDTFHKKIKFKTKSGEKSERLVDLMWDKKDRSLSFLVPPLNWLFGGDEPTHENIQEVKREGVEMYITLSGVEWIHIEDFFYEDIEYDRIGPCPFENLKEEEKMAKYHAEEKIEDPFANCKTEAEIEKKKEEIKKQLENEELEMTQLFKRAKNILFIHGKHFRKSKEGIWIQLSYDKKAVDIPGVYKNENLLAVALPDIDWLPPGIHEIFVEISFNGQQFSQMKKKFRYMAFDKNLTPEQRQKLEDEEIKKLKKPAPKK